MLLMCDWFKNLVFEDLVSCYRVCYNRIQYNKSQHVKCVLLYNCI